MSDKRKSNKNLCKKQAIKKPSFSWDTDEFCSKNIADGMKVMREYGLFDWLETVKQKDIEIYLKENFNYESFIIHENCDSQLYFSFLSCYDDGNIIEGSHYSFNSYGPVKFIPTNYYTIVRNDFVELLSCENYIVNWVKMVNECNKGKKDEWNRTYLEDLSFQIDNELSIYVYPNLTGEEIQNLRNCKERFFKLVGLKQSLKTEEPSM